MEARDTKTQIMDVAEDLICRIGPNALSYQHISEAVAIRKASIHYHFPSKEDLLHAVMERYARRGLAVLDDILASPGSADKKLKAFFDFFEQIFGGDHKERACVSSMMGAELTSLGPETSAVIRKFYRDCEKRLAQIVEEGRKAGVFRKKGDARTIAGMIFAFLLGTGMYVRAEGGAKKFHALLEEMRALLKS